jgi:hypothetical protein
MKNKLTLSLLLSLSTGIAMHASDDATRVMGLISQKLHDVSAIIFMPYGITVTASAERNPTVRTYMPVFTDNDITYIVTRIELAQGNEALRLRLEAAPTKNSQVNTKRAYMPRASTPEERDTL